MKTYSPKPQDIERRWYVIDASGAVLGRLASEAAAILRGKHKPIFAPHADTGDHVIVVNAKEVQLTGGKEAKKFAYRHSGYPGGLTATQYTRLLAEKPVFAVEKAIKGMLPKNRLGRAMARKLQVYAGAEHPHGAQKPEALKLGEVPAWTGLPETKAEAEPKAKRERRAEPEPEPETAPKKASARSTTAKKATARKPAAKKTTATKPAATPSTAGKPAAKKTTAAKPAAKKTTAAKPATRRRKKEE
jgi:large subunit ribosomal protein L13